MYGLEKKNKELFQFDLEEEINNDNNKGKQYLDIAKKRTEELKTKMRKGDTSDDFDQLGTLLHGYTALNKVLLKVVKQKS
jgi:Family of unknown function (DUF5398)